MKKIVFAAVVLVTLMSCGGEKKTAQYQCPMKCEGEKTYDKPGTCPLCKMDLKEVK